MKQSRPEIELNDQFKLALDMIENSGESIFITGRAGTGKSTLLSYFSATTHKKVAILAPTGVAALNVKGQTIHSFCRFKPNITFEKVKRLRYNSQRQNIYEKLETIVIDEVSMVRADLLDCVDKFLRLNGPDPIRPFGGIQMVLIGDLYQLPPVVTRQERELFNSLYPTPFFYSAHVFESFNMEFVELQKVYRQRDEDFISILNSIRNRSIDENGLATLNTRFIPEFQPLTDKMYVYLTTTNALAEQINGEHLSKLGTELFTFAATIDGEFGREYLPTASDLSLKERAQVMMLNNDAEGRWVNGSIGEITGIIKDKDGEYIVMVELADGKDVDVTPFTWEIYSYSVESGHLESQVVGSFTQYPMMLAWAVTIHKSQGKTFDNVIIDFGRGTFAHGQAYVALSRCTSLEGIVLKKPFIKSHILMDYNVVRFLSRFQQTKPAGEDDHNFEVIARAIRKRAPLSIVYLKPDNEKTKRVVLPKTVGEMQHGGQTFMGMRAFCTLRNEERTFKLDRILEIKEIDPDIPPYDEII